MKQLLSLVSLVAVLLCLSLPSHAVVELIKQGATSPGIQFLLVDTATGQVGQTGQAGNVVIKLRKSGGTGAGSAGTVTEIDAVNFPGVYEYTPTSTETNTLGILTLDVTCTGCQRNEYTVQIVAFDPNDPSLLGLTGVATASAQATNATAVTAIKAKTDTIGTNTADSPNQVASQGAVTTVSTNVGTLLTRLPGVVQPQTGDAYARLGTPAGASIAADIAALPTVGAIWNATAGSYNTAGSLGAKLNSAGTASDPWASLLASYSGSTTFGGALKAFLSASPSGWITSGSYAAGTQVPTGFLTNEYAPIANTLLTTTVYGGLTFKQIEAINFALQLDASRTWNAGTHTSVYTWYVRTGINTIDLTKPLVTKTTVYDSTNSQIVTQSTAIVTGNLPQ